MCNVTHFLLVKGKDVMRLPFTKCAISLTNCWSWENMWSDCLSQNVQCDSQTVGHRKICNETAFYKMCNVTHILLVIGEDVTRLPFTKCPVALTCYSGHRQRCDETAFHKMCNVTHKLLVMWWDCFSQNDQCHSLAIGHRKRCDETAFHKMSNVTHFLSWLEIRKDVMRLPFTECPPLSLTPCWP